MKNKRVYIFGKEIFKDIISAKQIFIYEKNFHLYIMFMYHYPIHSILEM